MIHQPNSGLADLIAQQTKLGRRITFQDDARGRCLQVCVEANPSEPRRRYVYVQCVDYDCLYSMQDSLEIAADVVARSLKALSASSASSAV
jgi:hypothetical protein